MKKTLKTIAVLLVAQLTQAQNPVKIADITIPQNGQGELVIQYEFPSDGLYTGYSMSVTLPDGITLMKNDEDKYIYTMGECHEESHKVTINYNETKGAYSIGCLSLESDPLSGTSGILLTLQVKAEGNLTAGSILQGSAWEVNFAKLDAQTDFFTEEVEFDITIGAPADTRTILDENSTSVPASASGVDVRVKRTINANQWSTICLPFAMTEEQCKEAFGEDVQLADFNGTDPEFDGDDCVGITANFISVNAIEANHPYIIMVSQPVSEFTLDGVDIEPRENDACIEFDNGRTGSRRVVYSGFYGTYHAGTELDKFTLFLSDNKFWYSKGLTKMKGFRAYFYFLDILTDVENSGNVKLWVSYDQEDGLQDVPMNRDADGIIYDLGGRRVSKPVQRGIYIENGKKKVTK